MILNSIELRKRGHKVFIACVKDSPAYKVLAKEGFEIVEIDEEKPLSSAKIIRKFLKKNSIDIVHTNHSKGHKIGLYALLFRKKEKLVVQRSVLFPTTNVFKYLNPRINKFIANSQAVKDVMVRHFVKKSKISVIYSATDKNQFLDFDRDSIRQKLDFKDKFVFGIVGNYSEYKGHDLLLSAFADLNKNNAMLVMIGKDTEKLSDKVNKLGIKDSVKILSFRKDAKRIMKGFDFLVIPSFKESFPNVAIEAFFMKVPVIGTKVGGIPELLSDNRGILCDSNVESLHNALLSALVADKDKIINNAYGFACKNLTIKNKVDKLEKLYMDLVV